MKKSNTMTKIQENIFKMINPLLMDPSQTYLCTNTYLIMTFSVYGWDEIQFCHIFFVCLLQNNTITVPANEWMLYNLNLILFLLFFFISINHERIIKLYITFVRIYINKQMGSCNANQYFLRGKSTVLQ